MAWIAAGASLLGDAVGSWFGASSADKANKTNIKLSRETRAWEEKMSNTAVRRRMADIQMAGGNPALAFTGGQSASTPTASSPTVEPTFRPEWMKGSGAAAAQLAAQLDLVKAQTSATSAQTRKTNAEAGIIESIEGPTRAAELEARQKENALFDVRLDKAIGDADISRATADLLQDKRSEVLDLLRAQVKQMEATGRVTEVNAESTEAIARTLGVAGKDVGPVGKFFLDIVKIFMTGK